MTLPVKGRCVMDVVVGLVGHLGHLGACRDAGVADQQLGAVDVDDLVDPGRRAAEEALDDGADDRLVRCHQGVLPGFVDLQHGAAGFQDAEMVGLDRQQRSRDDAVVDDLDGDVAGAEHVGAVAVERGDDLAGDGHAEPPD
jgi:hypothetical protein